VKLIAVSDLVVIHELLERTKRISRVLFDRTAKLIDTHISNFQPITVERVDNHTMVKDTLPAHTVSWFLFDIHQRPLARRHCPVVLVLTLREHDPLQALEAM